jgi:hypothetical protein
MIKTLMTMIREFITRGVIVTRDPKCVINLFDSGLSMSDDETAPLERP